MQLIKKAKWMLIGGIASVVILGIAGNLIYLNNQHKQLKNLALTILIHSENVATQIDSSIEETSNLRLDTCNEQNIEKLREIVWRYADVHDIGILENNKLACTANWGVLKNPVNFANLNFTISKKGYALLSSKKGILPYGVEMDITSKDGVVAFTSPFAFKEILTNNSSSEFFLASKNNKYRLFSHNIPSKKTITSSTPQITVKTCSATYDFCSVVIDDKKGILSLSIFPLLILALLGFIFGGVITYAIISFFSNSRSIEFRLKKAIMQKKLYLEYQPLVHAKTKRIVGVEALLRWNDKVFGQVSPDLFISISEKIGIYSNVSAFVCETAIDEMSDILSKNKELFLSINIGKTEINDPLFLDSLLTKAKTYDILPEQIKIEITERSNDSYHSISDFSVNAKDKGFMVSLDDFGTGVSNLIWLTEIHFDEIKLDKFFVGGLKNQYKKAILMAVLSALSGLNKRLVFEGVETEEDFEFVKKYNENALIQGWYFYKSLSVEKLQEAITHSNKIETIAASPSTNPEETEMALFI